MLFGKRKSWTCALAVMLCVALSGCIGLFNSQPPSAEELILAVEKIADPKGKSSEIKTMKIHQQIVLPEQKIYGYQTMYCIFPDLSYLEAVMPGLDTTYVMFDGKKAWQNSSLVGYRECVDSEFEQMRFDMDNMNPSLKNTDVFERFEFVSAPDSDLENDYWFVKCYPNHVKYPRIQPLIYQITKENPTVVGSEGASYDDVSRVDVISEVKSTKVFSEAIGIVEAEIVSQKRDNNKFKSKVISVEYNVPVSKTFFDDPKIQ